MRQLLIAIFLLLPCLSFGQGFTIRVGGLEIATDKIPDFVDLPLRVEMLQIKKDVADPIPQTYTLQIGEEEHTFPSDGRFNQVRFSHDIKGLVATILDEKRNPAAKSFILRRRQ